LAERYVRSHVFVIIQPREIVMKFALLGAALVATAAFATPALAFPRVVTNPGYCAQFYPNANCQDYGPGNPYTGSYQAGRGYWQNGYARMGRHGGWHRGHHMRHHRMHRM
jgi:hypothetical protein